MKFLKSLFRTLPAIFSATNLFAHQFWLEPSSYRPEVGAEVRVEVKIGADFPGETFERTPTHVQFFEIISGEQFAPVGGIPYRTPAGRTVVSTPGTHVVRYDSLPSYVELEAPKFQEYLAEEGLDEALRIREEKKATALPGRERFSRCAKSLILVGNGEGILKDRYVGQILEVLMVGPIDVEALPGEVEFEVRWQDKPMPNMLVRADNPGMSDGPIFKRSDAQGRVTFDLSVRGQWLISTVRIMEIHDDPKAEWESFWASLTFELPEAGEE